MKKAPMPKLIPFPADRVKQCANSLLICSASRETFSKPIKWTDRPEPPEALGNMLQHLVRQRPAAVLLLENIVADMLAQLAQGPAAVVVVAAVLLGTP
jgi:hypothetical protein